MYSPDTLHRINKEAVEQSRQKAKAGGVECEICGKKATDSIPVYNPADSVRGVKGAYTTIDLCDYCKENELYMENGEYFTCDGCGKLFVTHHSWDSLVCTIDASQFCHVCAAKQIKPITLDKIVKAALQLETDARQTPKAETPDGDNA